MEKELKKIFGDAIIVGGASVPTAHLRYKGKSKTYVVWSIQNVSGALYADDEMQYCSVTVDVDVYSEGNYVDVITEIKKIMKNNEWIWVEDSPEMYEDDTELYHKTLTFAKEGE